MFPTYKTVEPVVPRQIFLHLHRNDTETISSNAWLNYNPSNSPGGSWSGYGIGNNVNPLIIPFNCKIVDIYIQIREAGIDWRATPGNAFMGLGLYTHRNNGVDQVGEFILTLEGSFSGGSIGYTDHRFDIGDNFTINSGINEFQRGDIIGFQYRRPQSGPGWTFNLRKPQIMLVLEEI